MKSGIYLIKNTVNNKVYVGSAVNIDQRWYQHKSLLKRGKHHSCHLQSAWNKYGEQSFTFDILEEVSNPEHLLAYEQVYLDYYKSYEDEKGYNICKTAGSNLGMKPSEETRKKMSEAQKGRIVSEETRKKMSEAAKKNITEETKQKRRGRKHSEETRKKMSEAKKNITEETRQKYRQRKHSDEAKQKIGRLHKGKVVSEETRQKMREASRKREDRKESKYYSFNKTRKKYKVMIAGKFIGYYNTEEEAKQAVADNLLKCDIYKYYSVVR